MPTVRYRPSLCKNSDQRDDSQIVPIKANFGTKKSLPGRVVPFGRSYQSQHGKRFKHASERQKMGVRPDRCEHFRSAENRHQAPEVIGEYVQAHFCFDALHAFR